MRKPRFREVRLKLDDGRQVVLREMRKSDAKDACRVLNKPSVRKFTTFQKGTKTTESEVLHQLDAAQRHPAAWYIVTLLDGKYVGRIIVFLLDIGKRQHVAEFGVSLDDLFGSRVDKALVSQAERFLKSMGVKKLIAGVVATNTKSIRLYVRMGYKKEAVLKRNIFDGKKYIDEILLSKWLS